MRFGLMFFMVLSLVRPVYCATIHVPDDQPTIQAGIDAASSGDTVLIACGIYFESNLFLPVGIILEGATGDQCAVIDGGQQGPILNISGGVSSPVVRNIKFQNGSASRGGAIKASGSPRIESCRFEDNHASIDGGAIYSGSPHVLNCEFIGNSAGGRGGAVDAEGSPIVEACTFRNNTAEEIGGGLAVENGEVRACWFESNSAGNFGGGLCIDYSGTALIHFCTFVENSCAMNGGAAATSTCNASFAYCRFERNTAGQNGGGLYVYNSDIPTSHCVFTENHADHLGGGYAGDSASYVFDHSSTLDHCTFWGNSAEAGGGVAGVRNGYPRFETCVIAGSTQGGSFAWGTSPFEPSFVCSDLWGNTGGDWTGLISDQANINGNVSADPLFCGPDNGDFTIRSNSPCAPRVNECGLVGALPVACGSVSVTSNTWGRIKSRYRGSP